MSQIENIDWEAKRFYLHVDTTTNGFDAWEAFAEVRLLQQQNANKEQNYPLFIQRFGKVPKGNNRFTPRYVTLLPGWRGVPNGTQNHQLTLTVEMISPLEEIADRSLFDRSTIGVNVDIDPVYNQVEVITVATGGGSTDVQPVLDAIATLETRAEADTRQVIMNQTREIVSRINAKNP